MVKTVQDAQNDIKNQIIEEAESLAEAAASAASASAEAQAVRAEDAAARAEAAAGIAEGDLPLPASQAQVNEGADEVSFVTPKTLSGRTPKFLDEKDLDGINDKIKTAINDIPESDTDKFGLVKRAPLDNIDSDEMYVTPEWIAENAKDGSGGFNTRKVITVSGTLTAGVDLPAKQWIALDLIAGGGAGGAAGQGGTNNTHGQGGGAGGDTSITLPAGSRYRDENGTVVEVTATKTLGATGGGGGSGGCHGSSGAGGGAGCIYRTFIYLLDGQSVTVAIGAGGMIGSNANAATYDMACGKGIYGGRPFGTPALWATNWISDNVSGGQGGGIGMPGIMGSSVGSKGGGGGTNGTGYGGGGGGGSILQPGAAESGGQGADGGKDGTGNYVVGEALHNVGGAGGPGAAIFEFYQAA